VIATTNSGSDVTVSAATAQLWGQYLQEWFEPSVISGVDTIWLFIARPSVSRHMHPTTLASRIKALGIAPRPRAGMNG